MTARHRRNPRTFPLVVASGTAVLVVVGTALAAAQEAPEPPGTDPLVEPVPRPEYVDDARSFVASVDFAAADDATAANVTVANAATPGSEHLEAHVTVRSESDGQVVRTATMPNPALSFADGVGHFFQAGRYDVLAPFDTMVDTIRLTTPDGRDIVAIDTTAAVRQFCIDHPDDPGCLEADLSVDSVQVSAPLFAVVGRPTTISVASTVANNGPDGPVDAVVARSASTADLTVDPATTQTTDITGLDVGESHRIDDSYTVTCVTPGTHMLTFTTAISPKRAWFVDRSSENDRRTTEVAIDCAVPITINIQPGSRTNPVNLTGSTLPVAALTTRAGEYGNPLAFDVTTIDGSTVRFGSAAALLGDHGVPELHDTIHPEDSLELDERTRDRDLDVLLHFRPRADALTTSDTQGCIYGRTTRAAGATPLEDFLAKFEAVTYVIDPGTSFERTVVLPNDGTLWTGSTATGILLVNPLTLGTVGPLPVGSHEVETHWTFSALHCDGWGDDIGFGGNCLSAGDTQLPTMTFTVTPGRY